MLFIRNGNFTYNMDHVITYNTFILLIYFSSKKNIATAGSINNRLEQKLYNFSQGF